MAGSDMIISPRVQKLLAAQRTTEFPYLIQVSQSGYSKMFFANSSDNITFDGNIYNAASFSIQPPSLDGDKVGNATLTISAIDQYWIQRIRETQMPAELQFTAVIVYDESGIAGIEKLEENSFTLRAARWDETSISWEMSFDERQGYIITSAKCTPQIAPGCA
jgi:hypothetical protein